MNIKPQSTWSRFSRRLKRASFGGLVGLTCLASQNAIKAQETWTPPSPDKPSVRPFAFVPAANKATELFEVTPESVFQATASPRITESEPAAAKKAKAPVAAKTTAPSSVWLPPANPLPDRVAKLVLKPDPDLIFPQEVDVAEKAPEAATVTATAVAEIPAVPDVDSEIIESLDQAVEQSLPAKEVAVEENVVTNEEAPAVADDTEIAEQADGFSTTHGFAGARNSPTPVQNILSTVAFKLRGGEGVNAVGHFSLLSLQRDYRGNGRALSTGAPNLFANGPDEDAFTGFDLGYGRRRGGGRGWEARLFGFDPDEAVDVAGSSPTLVWAGQANPAIDPNTPVAAGLSGIGVGGIVMADVFNSAVNHRVIRDSQLGSFEFNLLRASAAEQRFGSQNSLIEFSGGLRAVSFEESISFAAGAITGAGFPTAASYTSEVDNHLFGIQVGGRMERHFVQGWGYTLGTKVGIYNNRVTGRQRAQYQFADGSTATPQVLFGPDAGRPFDFSGTDNEVAFLGELDLGLIYQFNQRARARIGYRGIVVTNIAAAASQFEDNLFDVPAVSEPKALDDLVIGGFYFGADYAF